MEFEQLTRLLGLRIRYLREYRGLSQEQLADKIDLSSQHLSKIEVSRNANPTLETLNNIANALDVEISQLFSFDMIDKN